jgi:uroporphyrinogen-III synthase
MRAPTVVVTRPRGPAGGLEEFVGRLREEGFLPVVFSPQSVCFLSLLPDEEKRVVQALSGQAPCVALLSPTAVFACQELLRKISTIRPADEFHFASQGPGTSKAIEECFGCRPFFEATLSTAEGFASEFLNLAAHPTEVFVPQSSIGRDALGPLLRAGGVRVCEVAAYSVITSRPNLDEQRDLSHAAAGSGFIVFMSPSAVRATIETCSDRESLAKLRVVSIGPSTSEAIRESGLHVTVEAVEHSEEGVVRALRDCVTGDGAG